MNMPENDGKEHFFRIFRQIPAKSCLESLYLQEVSSSTVEMRKIRSGY